MSKVMLGWGSYASIRDTETARTYYRSYLWDPREAGILRLSRRRFWHAGEAVGWAARFLDRYQRLLTARGKCGRVPPVLMSYPNKLHVGDLEDR